MEKRKVIDRKEVWEVLEQLGLHTHYLGTKAVEDWDEYDHSNYGSLLIKAGRAKLEKAFVIVVALDFKNFEHYAVEPQVFYNTYEEADIQMRELIQTKQYKKSQLKIQKLWKTTENNY